MNILELCRISIDCLVSLCLYIGLICGYEGIWKLLIGIVILV